MKSETASAAGSIVSGVLASACCIGPLVFAFLGISGAAAARAFEPLRVPLLAVTFVLLGLAFHLAYRSPARRCGPGETCELPATNRAGRVALWVAAAVALLAAAFPWYSVYLF